jgi:hypothetical protein
MATGRIMPSASLAQMESATREANAKIQREPVIQSLAAHVRKRWESAKEARNEVDLRMADNLRRRRGVYSEEKLREIREFGGSEIFLGITSVKCRAAAAWLRETLMGVGTDRPWQLEHTPIPELPEEVAQQLMAQAQQELMMTVQQGVMPDIEGMRQQLLAKKDEILAQQREIAKERVERMERKIEDQLVEGGWVDSFSQFIDDLVTFPTAVMKGPVPRMRKTMQWQGSELGVIEDVVLEWERVDPFMIYPAAWSSCIDDGPLIERHRLTRDDLQAMLGVPGYNDAAIRAVLMDFDSGGLREWLWSDSAKAEAEGKTSEAHRPVELIDALQLWDSVQGSMLIEWGVDEAEIEDPVLSYPCEIWLVDNAVIRAVLNYDPLGRKPYFATSYERVPGAFWGNAVVDLVRDPQDMANAAARSLANNMGISSGPQVMVNASRMPADAKITQMYPWKIWQTTASDFQDNQPPISFFQPTSNAGELLGIVEKFSALADEYSGIPKYMTGEHVAGAGRTSSGLAMLINNAAKSLKNVVGNVDQHVISPMLERIYQHNLRYSQDPDMVGDVRIIAKGAMSLVSREAAAVRRNEFLQIVLNSQLAQQIVGLPGAAELLRENARLLDVNTDRIVPSREDLQVQMQQQAMMNAMMMQQAGAPAPGQAPTEGSPTLPDGSREGGRDMNTQSPRPNNR